MHPPPTIHHEWYQIVQWTLRNDLSDVDRLTAPENHQIDYISGASQLSINILVSTHIFPGARNPIKALFSVLDDTTITCCNMQNIHFKWSAICPVQKITRLTISGTSQRRIHILVSTHIFSGVRNPIKALLSVLDYYNMLKHIKHTFKMVYHVPKLQLI